MGQQTALMGWNLSNSVTGATDLSMYMFLYVYLYMYVYLFIPLSLSLPLCVIILDFFGFSYLTSLSLKFNN